MWGLENCSWTNCSVRFNSISSTRNDWWTKQNFLLDQRQATHGMQAAANEETRSFRTVESETWSYLISLSSSQSSPRVLVHFYFRILYLRAADQASRSQKKGRIRIIVFVLCIPTG